MQPRPEHDAQIPGDDASRPLPAQLARSLGPKTKHALMHQVRRRILRTLNDDPAPRAPKDLLPTFPGVSLSAINYHLLVLEECESVAVSRVERTRGTYARSLVSNVADEAQYLVVLRATEQLDDVR